MNFSYMLYQADHVKSARQQREDDIQAGELAAEFGRLWHSLAPRRAGGQARFRQARGTGAGRPSCPVQSCQPRSAAVGHRS
jgi:hypothetical protein